MIDNCFSRSKASGKGYPSYPRAEPYWGGQLINGDESALTEAFTVFAGSSVFSSSASPSR